LNIGIPNDRLFMFLIFQRAAEDKPLDRISWKGYPEKEEERNYSHHDNIS